MDTSIPYKKLCTQFYNLSKPEARLEEVSFYTNVLDKANPILEAMCGSGRLLIPLLRMGFDIEGVDNSSDMLESCRRRALETGLKPQLYLQNITHLTLSRKYQAIIIAFGSFQLITDRAQVLVTLQQLKKHLAANGILILDIFTPESDEPEHDVLIRTVECADGSFIRLTSQLHKNNTDKVYTSKNHYEHIYNNDILETEDETLIIRWYSEDELKSLLLTSGFSHVDIQPASFDQQQVTIFIAHV